MEGYGANTYGDRHAGVYDDWYGADGGIAISQIGSPEDVATAVADLAAGGAVLELGVGTGRLALPIADRGLDVTGLDASSAMLDVLRAKPGAERLTLNPDCGFAPGNAADIPIDEAYAKLSNEAEAAAILREKYS